MCLAIPGEVISVFERDGVRFAEVRFGGVAREVCLHAQPHARAGDFVLVHVGYAIATIDRAEAARTWEALLSLGQLDEARRELEGATREP